MTVVGISWESVFHFLFFLSYFLLQAFPTQIQARLAKQSFAPKYDAPKSKVRHKLFPIGQKRKIYLYVY